MKVYEYGTHQDKFHDTPSLVPYWEEMTFNDGEDFEAVDGTDVIAYDEECEELAIQIRQELEDMSNGDMINYVLIFGEHDKMGFRKDNGAWFDAYQIALNINENNWTPSVRQRSSIINSYIFSKTGQNGYIDDNEIDLNNTLGPFDIQ